MSISQTENVDLVVKRIVDDIVKRVVEDQPSDSGVEADCESNGEKNKQEKGPSVPPPKRTWIEYFKCKLKLSKP